jgi:hypothetical protein
MSKKILVITRNFYAAEEVKKLLVEDDVFGCHRDYHVEGRIRSFKPDFILSDGTCKTRFDENPESVAISFDPKPFAEKYGIPVRSLSWFLFVEKIKKVMFMRAAI